MLDAILTPRVLAVLGIIGLGLFAFSFAWAFFKVSYQKAVGKPVPRFWLTNACDVLAEIGANLPGAINRALKLAGKPGLFLPTAPADGSAPTASAATIDALSAELTRLRDALAAYQRRVSDSHVVTEPNGFDPSQRQTIPPAVAAQIDQACREWGFFYIKGHPISAQRIDSLLDHAQRFFAQPTEEKLRIDITQPRHHRGYGAIATEQLDPALRRAE